VYFDGVINGPHCIKFTEKGEEVIGWIIKKVMAEIHDDTMKTAVEKFGRKMKNILRLWLALQRQLMSVKRQSASDIETFKNNRDELRRAVVDLIELSNRTFPDVKQFPSQATDYTQSPHLVHGRTGFMGELRSI